MTLQMSMGRAPDGDVERLHDLTAIYTTGHVVEALLDRLDWPARPGRLLDPSAGDGAFVVAALARLTTPRDDLGSVRRVLGCEIYPTAVAQAQQRVAALLCSRGWSELAALRAAHQVVRRADFLAEVVDDGQFSIVAGNPPYLRFANLPAFFKGLYAGAVPVHARADLLHAFLDRCCSVLGADGLIGFVTADRWLFNETAGSLREILGQQVGLTHVARLDVLTSFYRPKERTAGTPPRIHPVVVVLSRRDRAASPITRLPISPDGTRSAPGGRTFGDLATVRLAPWLGPMGIFVVDATTAMAFPPECLVPAVDTDDINAEDCLAEPTRFAILTVPGQEPRGALRKHLLAASQRMPARGRSRGGYWLPPERITLDTSLPSLLVPRIARRVRVIDLPAGVLPINHNLHVVSANGSGVLDEVRRVLLSPETQAWIQANAPRLEGGFLSITTKLLRRMPA